MMRFAFAMSPAARCVERLCPFGLGAHAALDARISLALPVFREDRRAERRRS
jgi:hypothetical protein